MDHSEILILGAEPAALGAAWRLQETGHPNWRLISFESPPGEWAAPVADSQEFSWLPDGPLSTGKELYFRQCLGKWLDDPLLFRTLTSGVWIENDFIPIPLPGKKALPETNSEVSPPKTFFDWTQQYYNEEISKNFALPYAEKLWGLPPTQLGIVWGNDYRALTCNAAMAHDTLVHIDLGTIDLWQTVCDQLPSSRIFRNRSVKQIDAITKTVIMQNGETFSYDTLVSTLPLDRLIGQTLNLPELRHYTEKFCHTRTHAVGIGLRGKIPQQLKDKGCLFFPGDTMRAHMVRIQSNYSPDTTPGDDHWSLLCEVNFPSGRPFPDQPLTERMVKDLRRIGIIPTSSRVVSLWQQVQEYGQPIPFYGRDELLTAIQSRLREQGIFSCGRFGGWVYENGCQEKSFMQGKEAVDSILGEFK